MAPPPLIGTSKQVAIPLVEPRELRYSASYSLLICPRLRSGVYRISTLLMFIIIGAPTYKVNPFFQKIQLLIIKSTFKHQIDRVTKTALHRTRLRGLK